MFSTNLQRREGFLLMHYRCCTAVRYIYPLSSHSSIQCSRPDTRMCKCVQRPSLCTCRHESRAYLHRSASCARSASPQIPSGTRTDSHSPSPARGRENKKKIYKVYRKSSLSDVLFYRILFATALTNPIILGLNSIYSPHSVNWVIH